MAGPLFYDRIKETSTTTGTGTITLAGAVTGYRSFADVGNGNTCYYCIEAVDADGVPTGDWEVGVGTYTSSGTTLSRDTVLRTSAGNASAVSFAAGTKFVFLDAPANLVERITGLITTTAESASFTAVVGKLSPVDMSGAGADFTVTFPTSPSHGQRFGYYLSRAHASKNLIINRNSSNVMGGTVVTSHLLCNAGEKYIWEYDATSSGLGWFMAYDGRKPCCCMLRRDASQGSLATGDWRNIQFDNIVYDSGGMGLIVTNYRITIRRGNNYRVLGRGGWASTFSDQINGWGRIKKNGSEWATDPRTASGTAYMLPQVSDVIVLAAGDYLDWDMYHTTGSDQATGTGDGFKPRLMVEEILR